jgi:hypothetical protein
MLLSCHFRLQSIYLRFLDALYLPFCMLYEILTILWVWILYFMNFNDMTLLSLLHFGLQCLDSANILLLSCLYICRLYFEFIHELNFPSDRIVIIDDIFLFLSLSVYQRLHLLFPWALTLGDGCIVGLLQNFKFVL